MSFLWRSSVDQPVLRKHENVIINKIKGYHVVNAQQMYSTPGAVIHNLSVYPLTKYTLTVYGHSMKQNAYLVAYNDKERLYNSYTFLPVSESDQSSVMQFTTTETKYIHIGICFLSPKKGDTCYISKITMTPMIGDSLKRANYIYEKKEQEKNESNTSLNIIHWKSSMNQPPLYTNQNVIIQTGPNGHIITSQQTHSTPGVLLRNVQVSPNTKYRFKATGYANSSNAFFLIYQNGRRLLSKYVYLPLWKKQTISAEFDSKTNTSINMGICFTGPAIGNTVYLEEMLLDKISQTPELPLIVSNQYAQKTLQQPQENMFLDWTAEQYQLLINNATHTSLSQNLAQVNITADNGTPGVFIKVPTPENTPMRFILRGYTNHSSFRLCALSYKTKTELTNTRRTINSISQEHVLEFSSANNTNIFVGIISEVPMKGQSLFIKSMTLQQITTMQDKFISPNHNERIEIPYKETISNIHPQQSSSSIQLEILESPGECLESPGLHDEHKFEKHVETCKKLHPRQIPAEIKNIEVQIFEIIDSINNMNINLSKTEKKLIEKIKLNTS